MQLRTYTPFFKIASFTACGFIILASYNSKRNIIIGLFMLLYILLALQTYKIVLENKAIVIYKAFSKALRIEGNSIHKIELESIKNSKLPAHRLYVYVDSKIYETSISWFSQSDMLKGLINFCAANSIEMDVSNYKQ